MILRQNLTQKWVRKMTEESYIIVYTMIYRQNLTQKWVRKMTEE